MPRDIPLSNGRLCVAFDRTYAIRDLCFPRVGMENHAMGRRSRIAVQVDGRSSWVGGDGWTADLRYEEDTLVTRVTLTSDELGLVLFGRDAIDPDEPVLLRSFLLENRSAQDREVTVWLHHDLDILESDAFCAVAWDPETRSMLHHKRDRWFLAGLTTGVGRRVDLWSCDARSVKDGRGVAGKIEDGDPCDNNAVSVGPVDAAVGTVVALPARGTGRIGAYLVAGMSEDEVKDGYRRVVTAGVDGLIDRASERFRQDVRPLVDRLDGAPADLASAAVRSLLVLQTNLDRDGAVSAANDSDTLFPGRESYAYCWPRDGALAAHALDRAGMHERAGSFFRFCARVMGEEGWLGHRYWADGTPGSSWLARTKDGQSVTPIQEDETSLVLWALGEHRRHTDDLAIVDELFESLVRPAATFLCDYRDTETGLPLPSWDLWEERWGVHTFTAASVARGLEEAAHMAELLGETEVGATWRAAAAAVDRGMDHYLFHERLGRYARCGHRDSDGGYFLDTTVDASLCWLSLLGARAPDHPRLRGTLDAVREHLEIRTDIGGIARYQDDPFLRPEDDPDEVPGNPWVLCTLALAECELIGATSDADRAVALERVRWAVRRALPSGVLPEQLHPSTGALIGVSPLTWSHAMLVGAVTRCVATRGSDRLNHALP